MSPKYARWILGMVMLLASGANAQTVLTLEEAVERALQSSRAVSKAKIDVQIGNASFAQNFTMVSPKIMMGWNYTYFGADVKIPFQMQQGAPPQEILIRPALISQGNLMLVQPLTGVFAALKKALVDHMRLDATKLGRKETEAQVAFAAAKAYRGLQLSQAKFQIAKERAQIAKQVVREADENLKLGRYSNVDLKRVEVAHGQIRVGEIAARAEFEIGLAMFRDLIGLEQGEDLTLSPLPAVEDIKDVGALPDLLSAQTQALAERNDLKIARIVKRASHDGAILPMASIVPEVNLTARWDENFSQVGNFGVPSQFGIGFNLNWTLWDGGTRILQFQEARLNYRKAGLDLIDKQRNAEVEVRKMIAEVEAAREVLEIQKLSRQQAEDVFQGMAIRFRLGAIGMTDYTVAEVTYNDAKVNLASAIENLDTKNMSLQKALGKSRPSSIF